MNRRPSELGHVSSLAIVVAGQQHRQHSPVICYSLFDLPDRLRHDYSGDDDVPDAHYVNTFPIIICLKHFLVFVVGGLLLAVVPTDWSPWLIPTSLFSLYGFMFFFYFFFFFFL